MARPANDARPDSPRAEAKRERTRRRGAAGRLALSDSHKIRPPHIHFKAAEDEAKFWLDPTELASNYGFSSRELNEVSQLVEQNEAVFLEAWNEYFS
ncbi:MAG: DUF4160 domain-containing protein [Acidobacteriota bacterium]